MEIAHLKRWQFVVGYLVLVVGIVIALASAQSVSKKTDEALCVQQRAGVETLRSLLVDVRDTSLQLTPPEDRTDRFNRGIEFYNEKIAELERPIPCEEELGL